MKKHIIFLFASLLLLSCNSDDEDILRTENGEIWRSGGLYYCAEQIHLDNGDTLIVNIKDVITYVGGDRVTIKYKELGRNENCSYGINCQVIELNKIE
ncbi:hypothetical protein SYJ56_21135 [Algoriphagus sp. D3-2-R+10]|uniref:hypothetical protein n=1 Tax=Algoriphagus aurantiacus TaxID=3103948 RepID=UPI002B39D34D|nr:hypothetical protein [Algoriphagus sp. D3-2-R+10]MEB2777833.1 hypothetical protein [Algoriphagus sp. D3-2-R+10]